MKIIYVTGSMPYGSGETFFIPEVKELLRQGHHVLIVPRSPSGRVISADARSLEAVSLRRSLLSFGIMGGAALEFARQPVKCLKALRLLWGGRVTPDLVRNLAVYPKGLWLARLARRQGFDHIHAHWARTTASMAMVAAEVSGVPWSFTAHRGDIVGNSLLPVKVEHARFVRFISQSGVEMAHHLGVPRSSDKVRLIRMGVDVPAPPSAKARISAAPTQIFCPANLEPVKGHTYLLAAMAILKQRGVSCHLEVAGDGVLRGELESQALQLNIADVVSFSGYLPHDAILGKYERAEVGMVVLPSVDLGNGCHEGIPVCLIEAMSYAIPVLSTATGGIPELLGDGAGILAQPGSAGELADAIEKLIGEPEHARATAERGRQRVVEDYSVEKTAAQLIACIESIRPDSTRFSSGKADLPR